MKTKLLLSVALGVSVLGTWACSGNSEGGRSSGSALTTPRPIFKMRASSQTLGNVGIKEWRAYAGKHRFVITGYGPAGNAVHGMTFGFVPHTATTSTLVKFRALDGSHFTTSYDYKKLSFGSQPKDSTVALLVAAQNDFTALGARAGTLKMARLGGAHLQGIRLMGDGAGSCAGSASTFALEGLGCGAAMMTIETGAGMVAAVSACGLAAKDSIPFLKDCYGGSGSGSTPDQNCFSDPGGSGFTTCDNSGSSNSADPSQNSADPSASDPSASDPSASDPSASDPSTSDPSTSTDPSSDGQVEADAAGSSDSCDSCNQDQPTQDVAADDNSGDVSFSDQTQDVADDSSGGGDVQGT